MQKTTMTRWAAALILTTALFSTGLYGQPSSSIAFVFRLYDKGQAVGMDRFCKEWTIVNRNGGFISPCDKNAVGSSYEASSGYFHIYIGAIYPPYAFTLIHQKDTMAVIFPTKTDFVCDSLTIHKGSFLFDHSCVKQEEIKLSSFIGVSFCPLNNIDWVLQQQKYKRSIYNKKE